MERIKKTNHRRCLIAMVFLSILITLFSLPLSAEIKISKEQRDDGLTIVLQDQGREQQEIQYLTLILKTGSAHDPASKSGLTNLTNEIVYSLLERTSALRVTYQTYADYSAFHFVVTRRGYNLFYSQLDRIIRLDALLDYDLCNDLIRYHLNLPQAPDRKAISRLYSLVYGPDHPYNAVFDTQYDRLDITEVNKWFRQIYKSNNLIIATGIRPPDDFLKRPAGRDLKQPVNLSAIPPAAPKPVPELKWTPVHNNIATVCLGFETSRFGEEGVLATLLLQKYLDQRLWKIIREDNGLSYDPEVFYQLTGTASAPLLLVTVHTLAENTGTVINLILAEFKKIAAEGIPEEEIKKIIERERKQRELMEKEPESTIKAAALYGFIGQSWLIDREDYLNQLTTETKIVSQVMNAGLARLKISVAGPEDTGSYLKNVTMETNPLK
ncbi:MAG: M16 family metallopeptidase [Bacteroidota bacterium]